MSRAALILHPVKVEDPDGLVRLVSNASADLGWDPPLVLETSPEEPGTSQARHAVEAGADLVLAAGGDGTVRAVCQALAGTSTPLALVPAGTGNLLARNLGIPLETPDAVRVAFAGQDRRIDVGEVDAQVFAVMAGLGFDAAMMAEVPEELKGRLGWPAYLVGAVRGLRRPRPRVDVVIDGRTVATRRAVRTALVGNVGRLQGGLELMPDAAPDDGVLDVCLLAPRRAWDWLWVAAQVVTRNRGPREDPRLQRLRGQEIVIWARGPQARQLDGEVVDDGASLRARVRPGALVIRVPAQPRA